MVAIVQIREIFHNIILAVLEKYNLPSIYSLYKTGPLKDDGWFRSCRDHTSVDANGNPIPWITYPAIEFLGKRINKQLSVFEYGCGNSTLWWASRVKEVISVEHDKRWYDKFAPIVPQNVTINHVALEYGGAYAKQITAYKKQFDIIVIDGRDRINCAVIGLDSIKNEGVIILDNSDRRKYEGIIKLLQDKGFRKIEFIGMCPAVNLKSETAIFYKDNNVLNI
jgi:hypothetical protein